MGLSVGSLPFGVYEQQSRAEARAVGHFGSFLAPFWPSREAKRSKKGQKRAKKAQKDSKTIPLFLSADSELLSCRAMSNEQ